MKQWKELLGIFMSGALLMTGGVLPHKNAATAEGATDYGISNPRTENGVTTWDKIKFGSYYQDAEVQTEPIKWRVLSVDGNDVFLLADKILDGKPYNEQHKYVTWETCTLRKWLNENFYNAAFDDEEKKAVMETTVVNEDNPSYGTDGGNDTKDKVYLLSIAEAGNKAYGFDTEFNKRSETRKVKPTDYAKVNNVASDYGFGDWWLRSPGGDSDYATLVRNSIGVAQNVNDSDHGVRPALHINLSSFKVTDAGEVDSEGKVTSSVSADKIRAPRVKDGVTTWDCVYFGSYRQNCIFEKQQDIEWRVLSVNGDDAFLLADKVLEVKPYNEEQEYVTWEACTLRKWLNEDFYNEAFDDEEKKAVMETVVVNENNPSYDTEGGNDTKDKVYLLSIAEAINEKYGFDTQFDYCSKTRKAKNTDYAKVNNVDSSHGFGDWWLRSPGISSNSAADVGCYGDGFYSGTVVDGSSYGVRPTLHINLSSSSWSKVGEVSSVEQEDERPTVSPEPTKEPEPTASPESTKEPTPTDNPTVTPEPTKEPTPIDKPISSTQPTQLPTPTATAQPTPPSVVTQNPVQTETPVVRQLKLSSVKCAKNTKKITGKVSVSKASIKIKVGKKAYKKATVKGKKFTLKLNYKLKKKTKIIIKAEKKGYKSVVKSYTVK